MSPATRPEMAYPSFASATYTFSPSKWPSLEDSGVTFARFDADARTAGGVYVRHTSLVTELRLNISYRLLSTADRDALMAPDGSGFFHMTGGATFEYRDIDGTVYSVRFVSKELESVPAGYGRWDVGPIEMAVVQ